MTAHDTLAFTEVLVEPVLAVQSDHSAAMNAEAIGAVIGPGYQTLMAFITEHGLTMVGPPRAIYTGMAQEVQFTLAIPIATTPNTIPGEPPIRVGTLAAQKAYRFTHQGAYSQLPNTYNQITALMKEKGLMQTEADWARYMPMWEEYVSDAHTTPEAELITYIYLPAV